MVRAKGMGRRIRSTRQARLDQRGYTLIELMIILTIVAVLASIAVPQYFNYVRDSRRADAIASLNRMLAQQELFYANNNSTYTNDVRDLGYPPEGGNDIAESEEEFYLIQMASCGAGLNECVELQATPVAGRSQDKDAECTSFTLNSRGRQTASSDNCWN